MDRYIPVAAGAVFYSCLSAVLSFLIKPPEYLPQKEKRDFIGQHVSIVHSLNAILFSFAIYFYDGGLHYNDVTTITQAIALGHTVGYMVYDMLYSEIFSLFDWPMRIHHLAVLIGGNILMAATYGGSPSLICIIITEMSNPFNLSRSILKARHMEETKIYKVVELAFALIFLVNRCLFGSLVIYNAWASNIGFLVKTTMSIVHGVGIFWSYVILSMISKKFRNNKGLAVKILSTITMVIKRNRPAFVLFIMMFSFIMPYFMTSILKTGFVNIRYGNFIII
ncbi:unnamed protein product [Blepharisma stoltei]|uniref:TLC domain-containing protein n=1 Tax=Blepharisma stoltei TaxID=1481888 RepID=A0AAU9IPD0_9CILI|nr:unnamed protein product [Blepharisma stoltei]